MIRKAAVAGYFYPGDKKEIEEQIESFAAPSGERESVYGAVAPHAGYRYSGPVAARVYARLKLHGTVVLLGPNHGAGRGGAAPPVSAMLEGSWELPTGYSEIDGELAALLAEKAGLIEDAPWAHDDEHSLEVQIPFLQLINPEVRIVPIIIGRLEDDRVFDLADGVYEAIEKYGRPVTLIASTDFSHYVPQEKAEALDGGAMERIRALDAEGLIKTVRRNRISMCGVLPTAAVMEVCRRMGATEGELVSYQTSGDVTGDRSSVVGYGGFLLK